MDGLAFFGWSYLMRFIGTHAHRTNDTQNMEYGDNYPSVGESKFLQIINRICSVKFYTYLTVNSINTIGLSEIYVLTNEKCANTESNFEIAKKKKKSSIRLQPRAQANR